jgi:hypothetical protein
MMESQKAADCFDCTWSSFRRTPESRNIEYSPDAGIPRHGGKQTFPTFCDAIMFSKTGFF